MKLFINIQLIFKRFDKIGCYFTFLRPFLAKNPTTQNPFQLLL